MKAREASQALLEDGSIVATAPIEAWHAARG
jgi:hypothetical protein